VAGDDRPGDRATWGRFSVTGEPTDFDSELLFQRTTAPFGRGPFVPRIAGFELARLLGSGATADVWLAQQQGRLERLVAIKVLRSDRVDLERLARFQTEALALSAVDDERFVRPFEAGICDDGRPYIAMEYCQGEPLRSDRAGVDRSLAERVAAIEELAAAVGALHLCGIIHRDLKPGNVLLERGPRARLRVIDLGLAKFTMRQGPGVTLEGALVGTPEYMSPEQAGTINAEVGAATDVFSIGVMLYELVEGRLPWRRGPDGHDAASYQRLLAAMREQPPAPPVGCDGRLRSIILRAIASDPRDRFRNALELHDALALWRTEPQGADRFKSTMRGLLAPMAPSPRQSAGILGVVIVAFGSLALWLDQPAPVEAEQRVVWTTGGARIYSARLDGTDRRSITRCFHAPRGIDFDAVEGFLYWADFGGRIERCRLDGSDRTVIASYPKAVNLDVFAGQVYWAVYGDQPCIWYARTDGVGPRHVTRAVRSPTGVRALGDGRFAFGDWELNGIFIAEKGGPPERITIVDGVYGIDARDGWIYFGDRTSERILSVHADTREQRTHAEGAIARGVWQVAVQPDGARVWWTRQDARPAICSAEIRVDGTVGASREEFTVDQIPWGLVFVKERLGPEPPSSRREASPVPSPDAPR